MKKNCIWNVSIRSVADQQVTAVSVYETTSNVVFIDENGELAGEFKIDSVQAYSKKLTREPSIVCTATVESSTRQGPSAPNNKVWKLLVRPGKQHRLEASEFKICDKSLMFTNTLGEITGKFRCKEVIGRHVDAFDIYIELDANDLRL